MSSHKCTTGEAFIQELQGIGLSPDQIFQLLMKKEEVMIEKEKTIQQELNRLSPDQMFQLLMKKEELKILEFEDHSKKKRKHDDDTQSSPSESDTPLSKKKACNQNQFIHHHRKSLHDLCTDELVTIFNFIPDFGTFKLARVSKQFHEIVLNDIKKVHLITQVKKDNGIVKGFLNSGCFRNIESLIIDFEIQLDLVEIILKNSDNFKVLKLSIVNDQKFHYLQFSICPSSSFKKLETLHIKCSNEHLRLELRHFNLYNLTYLKIEGIKHRVSHCLNERVNNIKKLHLSQVNCDSRRIPTMKMLTHLTLEECKISDASLCSLFVDTLERVSIETCKSLERSDDEDDQEEELDIPSEFPNLKTLMAIESEEIDITTMFESKLPNLTNLVLDKLTESYAIALSENTSITSLKKLFFCDLVERGELKMLIESKTFFKEIQSVVINATQLDSNALLYISKNASMVSNLKELEIVDHCSGLSGYQSFFTSEQHFNNLEKLTITTPQQMEDLNYLAQTTSFPKLKTLCVIGSTEKSPENFFSLFSNNTNFNQLSELGFSFLDDSSISYIKSLKNLQTVYVSIENVTAWGLKQLDEQKLKWTFIEDHFDE